MHRSSYHGLPLLACALLLASCGSTSVSLRHGARSYTPGDYEDVYERWTRTQESFAFGRLEDLLAVTATYESWDFRWAYTIRYAEDYGLSPQQRSELLSASLADAQKWHRFFVTLAGTNIRESDLTSKYGAWRVLMVDEHGNTLAPVEIEKVRRAFAPERIYFPSMSPYRLAYRISFPTHFKNGKPVIPPGAQRILLRFTGALGTVDLKWKLQSGAS